MQVSIEGLRVLYESDDPMFVEFCQHVVDKTSEQREKATQQTK